MKSKYVINDEVEINNILIESSPSTVKYIEQNNESKFTLISKKITHSDVITSGKNTTKNVSTDFLTYLSEKEQKEWDEYSIKINSTINTSKSAHQSNIFVPREFYDELGLRKEESKNKCINDKANVFLAIDSISYFNIDYTEKIFQKLNKQTKWKYDSYNLSLSSVGEEFVEITLHYAVHGIGLKIDENFHKLRHSIFKGDWINLLIENRKDDSKNLFIILSKNTKFYNILNLDSNIDNHSKIILYNKDDDISSNNKNIRSKQGWWRKQLIDEMLLYSSNSNDETVFCPFTNIFSTSKEANTIFRASHIKRFENCKTEEEKWDPNNGLLLSANADALFDKFLITISHDKKLIFSSVLKNENKIFLEILNLSEDIFTGILNDERMKYIEWHRNEFNILERKRTNK